MAGGSNHAKPPAFQLGHGEVPPAFKLSAAQVQRGITEGYWVYSVDVYRNNIWSLTKKGEIYFQAIGVGGDGSSGGVANFRHSPLQPHIVRITGIRDNGPKEKFVIYEWNWQLDTMAADPLRDFLKDSPPFETAVEMDLYDDGWRVVGWNRETGP